MWRPELSFCCIQLGMVVPKQKGKCRCDAPVRVNIEFSLTAAAAFIIDLSGFLPICYCIPPIIITRGRKHPPRIGEIKVPEPQGLFCWNILEEVYPLHKDINYGIFANTAGLRIKISSVFIGVINSEIYHQRSNNKGPLY